MQPSHAPARSGRRRHVLSVDVEEYFHVEAASQTVRPADWPDMDSRLAPAVDRILEILAEQNATATFFILGWLGLRQAQVVARIARAGHEIASHGMNHQMIHRLQPKEFRDELGV